MSLTLDSGSRSYGPGVLVSEATITAVTDLSGTMPEGFTRPIELGIELELEIGQSFRPKLRIYGTPGTKEGRTTWGGAFPIRDLFKKLGCKGGLTADMKIPPEWIVTAIGKKIYRVSYASHVKTKGGVGYSDWKIVGVVGLPGETPEALAAKFLDEHARTGYPKNYKPELLTGDPDLEFPTPEGDPGKPPMISLWEQLPINL